MSYKGSREGDTPTDIGILLSDLHVFVAERNSQNLEQHSFTYHFVITLVYIQRTRCLLASRAPKKDTPAAIRASRVTEDELAAAKVLKTFRAGMEQSRKMHPAEFCNVSGKPQTVADLLNRGASLMDYIGLHLQSYRHLWNGVRDLCE
jgi:hypothetical protein